VSDKTGIEWTDATWNPTTGCDRVSPGCDHCYAMTLAPRLKAMGSPRYQKDGDPRTSGPGFGVSVHPSALDQPLRWRRPRRVFVNSMSDLFHDEIPDEYIARVWAVMALAPRHTFQVLTKRHGRMRSLLNSTSFRTACFEAYWTERRAAGLAGTQLDDVPWPLPNVWLGVSVENQQWADIRVPALVETPAAVRFLSCEPLLGPVAFNCARPEVCAEGGRCGAGLLGIDWVIVGGESGSRARPMNPDWARDLRHQCETAEVAFHFKQWGEWAPSMGRVERQGFIWPDGRWLERDGVWNPPTKFPPHLVGRYIAPAPVEPGWINVERVGKKTAGRGLDGRTWDEFPGGAR
jgi:protein gp37